MDFPADSVSYSEGLVTELADTTVTRTPSLALGETVTAIWEQIRRPARGPPESRAQQHCNTPSHGKQRLLGVQVGGGMIMTRMIFVGRLRE